MAISYLSKVYSTNPYVVPVDLNLMASVLSYKDKTFKKNAAMLDSAFQKMGAANVKGPARQYVATKVQGLIDNINGLGGVDLGNDMVMGQLEGMASDIYKDPIILKQLSTKSQVDAGITAYEAAKKDPKKSRFSQTNYNNYLKKANKWLTNPDLSADWSSDHKTYTPYVDLDKFASDTGKLFKASLRKVDGKDGWYINTQTNEYVLAEDVDRGINSAIRNSPEYWAQAKINGEELPGSSPVMANERMIKRYKDDKYARTQRLIEIDEEIVLAKGLKQDNRVTQLNRLKESTQSSLAQLNSDEAAFLTDSQKEGFWSDQRVSEVSRQTYTDNLSGTYAGIFSYSKTQHEYSKDDAKVARNKIQIDAVKNDIILDEDGRGNITARKDWGAVERKKAIDAKYKGSKKSKETSETDSNGNPIGTIPGTIVQGGEVSAKDIETNKLETSATGWATRVVVDSFLSQEKDLETVINEIATNLNMSREELDTFLTDLKGVDEVESKVSKTSLDIRDIKDLFLKGDVKNPDAVTSEEDPYTHNPQNLYNRISTRRDGGTQKTGNVSTRFLSDNEKKLLFRVNSVYNQIRRGNPDGLKLTPTVVQALTHVNEKHLKIQYVQELLKDPNALVNAYSEAGVTSRVYDERTFTKEQKANSRNLALHLYSVTQQGSPTVADGVMIFENEIEAKNSVTEGYNEETKTRTYSEDFQNVQARRRTTFQTYGNEVKKNMQLDKISPSQRNPGTYDVQYKVRLKGVENMDPDSEEIGKDSKLYTVIKHGVKSTNPLLKGLIAPSLSTTRDKLFGHIVTLRYNSDPNNHKIALTTYATPLPNDKTSLVVDWELGKSRDYFTSDLTLHINKQVYKVPLSNDRKKVEGTLTAGQMRRSTKSALNNYNRNGFNSQELIGLERNVIKETSYENLQTTFNKNNTYAQIPIRFVGDHNSGSFRMHAEVKGPDGKGVNILNLLKEKNLLSSAIKSEISSKNRNSASNPKIERSLLMILFKQGVTIGTEHFPLKDQEDLNKLLAKLK